MRRMNQITVMGLPALLMLAACESSTEPDLGGPGGNLGVEAMTEVQSSVDDELNGALIEELRYAMDAEGASSAALVSEAELAFEAAADAYAAGDAALAQTKADEARLALGQAWMDGLGDVGLDELFERAYHLRETLAVENDCVRNVDRVLNIIDRLIRQAEQAAEAGNKRRAAAYLMLVGQVVDRACVDVDVDRDNFAAVARFAMARANNAVDLAARMLPDDATNTQLRLLNRAEHLAEWAERAFQNHRFRRAFALARRAEIVALRAVIDIDGVQDEEIRYVYEVAETLLEEASGIEDPTEIQQRLIHMAEKLFVAGVERLEAGNVRGILALWRSAVVSMVALG